MGRSTRDPGLPACSLRSLGVDVFPGSSRKLLPLAADTGADTSPAFKQQSLFQTQPLPRPKVPLILAKCSHYSHSGHCDFGKPACCRYTRGRPGPGVGKRAVQLSPCRQWAVGDGHSPSSSTLPVIAFIRLLDGDAVCRQEGWSAGSVGRHDREESLLEPLPPCQTFSIPQEMWCAPSRWVSTGTQAGKGELPGALAKTSTQLSFPSATAQAVGRGGSADGPLTSGQYPHYQVQSRTGDMSYHTL